MLFFFWFIFSFHGITPLKSPLNTKTDQDIIPPLFFNQFSKNFWFFLQGLNWLPLKYQLKLQKMIKIGSQQIKLQKLTIRQQKAPFPSYYWDLNNRLNHIKYKIRSTLIFSTIIIGFFRINIFHKFITFLK